MGIPIHLPLVPNPAQRQEFVVAANSAPYGRTAYASNSVVSSAKELHNSRTSSAYVGKETARVVLAHNPKVYIACRSAERAHAAIADLKKVTGKYDIHFLSLDLASFASIRSAAEEFKRCNILIHIQILSC